jgi:hypothetical protein
MNPILEKIIIDLINSVASPEAVDAGKKALVDFLAGLASQTPTQIDDAVVKILASALGVSYP